MEIKITIGFLRSQGVMDWKLPNLPNFGNLHGFQNYKQEKKVSMVIT